MHNPQLNGKVHATPTESRIGSEDISTRTYENEAVLSLRDLAQLIRRRLRVIVLMVVLFAGGAAGSTFVQTPIYQASVKVLVGQEAASGASNNLQNEVQGLQSLTKTMATAVETRPVAQEVIQRLGLSVSPESFLENLDVKQVTDTEFIDISYEDPSPARAALIANTVGDVFSEQISEVSPSSSDTITAVVWERAVEPSSPLRPDPVRNTLLALVLGLMLGVGLAFLLDYLDDNWKSPEEVEQVLGVSTFGVIPAFEIQKSKKKGD